MTTENGGILRSINAIMTSATLGMMIWLVYTVSEEKNNRVRMDTTLRFIEERTREIVPRTENERRFEANERSSDQNRKRIETLEGIIYLPKNK